MNQIINSYLNDSTLPIDKRNYVFDLLNQGANEDELGQSISTKYGNKYGDPATAYITPLTPMERVGSFVGGAIQGAAALPVGGVERIGTGLGELGQSVIPSDTSQGGVLDRLTNVGRGLRDVAAGGLETAIGVTPVGAGVGAGLGGIIGALKPELQTVVAKLSETGAGKEAIDLYNSLSDDDKSNISALLDIVGAKGTKLTGEGGIVQQWKGVKSSISQGFQKMKYGENIKPGGTPIPEIVPGSEELSTAPVEDTSVTSPLRTALRPTPVEKSFAQFNKVNNALDRLPHVIIDSGGNANVSTLEELANEINDAKGKIFPLYDDMLKKTGGGADIIPTDSITNDFDQMAQNLSRQGAQSAVQKVNGILEDFTNPGGVFRERLSASDLNGFLQNVIKPRVRELEAQAGGRATAEYQLLNNIGHNANQALEDAIISQGGAGFKALKADYAALAMGDKFVAGRLGLVTRAAPYNLADQVAFVYSMISKANPIAALKSYGIKWTMKQLKELNGPDVQIAKAFKAANKRMAIGKAPVTGITSYKSIPEQVLTDVPKVVPKVVPKTGTMSPSKFTGESVNKELQNVKSVKNQPKELILKKTPVKESVNKKAKKLKLSK